MRLINWTDKRIGLWTFLRFVRKDKDGHRLWRAQCDCGTLRTIRPLPESQSCGCVARGRRSISESEMVGKSFGLLVALAPAGKKDGRPQWTFRCIECGETVRMNKNIVTTERQTQCPSCGRKRNTTHGHAAASTKTSEYMAYHNAKQRCTNPKVREYENYGGRGICFLFQSFEDFFALVGPKPTPQHSLDRFPNNDGNYEAGNLRWATSTEQLKNTRLHSLASRTTLELEQEIAKRKAQ